MSLTDLAPALSARSPSGRAILASFVLSIFTSAFLLFSIQPMFAKMVLPQLGGSPAVWSVAMVVFQALLLAGYAYAHALTRYLAPRRAALVHLALTGLTALLLPIQVSGALGAPPEEGQALWLVGLFLLSVGLPFFALAGNGPLLQAWFSRSNHPQAHDPYFLYGASNLGSFAALLLYPVLFEPLLTLRAQTSSWSFGFILLVGLILASARALPRAAQAQTQATPATPAPGLRSVLGWIALSFIPSGLLVAVTAHISTDVAAAPFLWVIPLALFLLTFVLIFRETPLLPVDKIARLLPAAAVANVMFSLSASVAFLPILLVHLGFFLMATLVCHDRLYRARPDSSHLTAFYLWMSFGGVLGGLFAGLIAPFVFNRILEYPILMVLCVLAAPALGTSSLREAARQAVPVVVLSLAALAGLAVFQGGQMSSQTAIAFFFVLAGISLLFNRRPAVVAAALPFLFLSAEIARNGEGNRSFERSFFGVLKLQTFENGNFRALVHGTTIHGAVRIRNDDGTPFLGAPKPLTYYHPDGAMAATLAAVPARPEGRRIGIVGLGTGAFACNGRAGDRWTYFEIDALVVRLARDTGDFPYLGRCTPQARMVVGDARLKLVDEPAAAFDYLLIDAFASDAIPTHLMTREAMALYLSRLAPDGLLVLHITNRHLELERVVAALAKELGLHARTRRDSGPAVRSMDASQAMHVVALARREETLAGLAPAERWHPLKEGAAAWTDDYSNILGSLWRHYRP